MHRAERIPKLHLSDTLESFRSRLASTSAGKLAGQDKSCVEGTLRSAGMISKVRMKAACNGPSSLDALKTYGGIRLS